MENSSPISMCLDEIDLWAEDILSFWDAFDNCIQHAINNDYTSIVIEWKISNNDVRWWKDFKADQLIAKQATRSTRKDA